MNVKSKLLQQLSPTEIKKEEKRVREDFSRRHVDFVMSWYVSRVPDYWVLCYLNKLKKCTQS